ncbi:MAG: folate-binding protein YgfZ [Gammaproteobacteria bacterium]|nr:folate-binding protein YgfZ [Gammaproteobacteria bacterium]
MKREWQDFLTNAGAEFEQDTVISYGNPEREQRMIHTGLVICDLSHLGLISVQGEDAAEYLQGQLTNDIHQVTPEHSQLSAACSPKGRMLANFRIFQRNNSYYLRLPLEQLESILKRLRMFMMMARVTIEDSSDSLIRIGVSGPDIEKHLASIIPQLPASNNAVTQSAGYTVIRLAGPNPRFEIYAELDNIKKLWNHLDVHAAAVGAGPWRMLDILAGIPTIYPVTAEAFVPQMTNMQLIDGVNFKKGCYTGQEIVARMQYLGKLKRRMFRIHITSTNSVNPGDKLYSANTTSGQGTGIVVDAQADPDGTFEGLAVIDINDAENNKLQLHDENGPEVTIKDLPYSMEIL